MSPPVRILATGLRPVRWNVAMTAALAEMHGMGQAPDTVRLHRYPSCVLLGRSQAAEAAADVDYCRSRGIDIVRRITGGGAVFMAPGMLAWDVVVDRRAWGGNLELVTRTVCAGVAAGLSGLGVEACFRPPSDIAIGGRRVSGSGGYAAGRSAVLQGTVLVGNDLSVMARALGLSEPTARERVTSLEAETSATPALPSIREAITVGLAASIGRTPLRAETDQRELALCEALLRAGIGAQEAAADPGAVPPRDQTCRASC
jgi:lipoate-protein ligase A